MFFARLDDLPPEAAADRQSYLGFGVKSLVAIPLTIGGSVAGVLTCGHLRSEREWPEALVHRLGLLGDIFANALSRKQSEAAVQESKALASTIFTSLHGHVAAVDRDGVIIAVNESWTRFARENGGDPARIVRRHELPPGLAGRDQPRRHGRAPGARGRRGRAGGPSAPGRARVRVPIGATARAGSRWRWSRSGGPRAAPSSPTSTSRSAGGRRRKPGASARSSPTRSG